MIILIASVFGTAIGIGVSVEDDSSLSGENVAVEDAVEIKDWYDLNATRENLSADYVLMNNLDEDTDGYDELVDTEDGWPPIGSEERSFTGRFYGNGYSISDLYINRSRIGYDHIGLFGNLGGSGLIEDVVLIDVDVTGSQSIGGLVGYLDGTLMGSYATGYVHGAQMVGGLIGFNNGTVRSLYTSVEVGADPVYFPASASVGGLTGINQGEIFSSYSIGKVITTESNAGGLVGYNYGLVSNSYARGNVEGFDYEVTHIGGLVGWNNQGVVENSYSTGNVNGTDYVGGLVGRNTDSMVRDSFWDVESSGQDNSDGGTGKTTSEMKDVATYTDTDNEGLNEPWDFVGDPYDDESDEDIWDIDEDEVINDGYPFLSWEEEDDDEEDDDDIPGFTSLTLVLGVMIAVAIYQKKKEWR